MQLRACAVYTCQKKITKRSKGRKRKDKVELRDKGQKKCFVNKFTSVALNAAIS